MFCTFCAVEKFYILLRAATTVRELIASYCVVMKRVRLITELVDTHFSITLLLQILYSDTSANE